MLDYSYRYLERKFYQKKCLDLNLHDFHPDTPPPFLCHMRKDLIKIEFFQVLGYVLQKN